MDARKNWLPKLSVSIGLLCIAGQVYSESIKVDTTSDVVQNDTKCSLREAVEYINQGMPEAGLNGCGGKNSEAIIVLEANKTYNLEKQIEIKRALQIMTNNVNNQKGTSNATVKMTGQDRLFLIKNDKTDQTRQQVIFSELNLEGNPQYKAAQGALIYNQEYLLLQYNRLSKGLADQGGVIFNHSASADKTAYVQFNKSIIENNQATQGAIIYSDYPSFMVSQSVLRNNQTTGPTLPTLLYSQTAFSEDDAKANSLSNLYGLKNSSIYNNTGYILNVRDGLWVNNVTLVKNNLGLYLNAPYGSAYVSNSIIAGNSNQNCSFSGSDATKLNNNLTNTASSDCGTGNSSYPNISIGTNALIAGSSVDGKCDLAPANGLLCPYNTPKDTFLGYFKPRLLMSYQNIRESLIVNRGVNLSGLTSGIGIACEGSDQRDQKRSDNPNELCDLGAIELHQEETVNVGQDIKFNQVAKFSIADQLTDSELVPASECNQLLGKREDGKDWQAGCLQIVQTNTPSKGQFSIDQEGNITYVPNGNWHGSDEFIIQVVTTQTRFSDSSAKYIKISGRVVQEPENNFENKTVNVGGGSFGLLALLSLGGLLAIRRYKM